MAAGDNALAKLHCRESGSGFPLVFVHGYLGGGRQWHRQVESPLPGVRVIAPCLPGFGDSAGMPPQQSIGGFARVLLDFLSERGVERFFLLGHSMGGMIVQEMTKQSPERVAALMLYGTGALGVIPGRFETMAESRQRVISDGIDMAAKRLPAKWLVEGKNSPCYSFATEIAGLAGLPAHLAGLNAMESWDGRDALVDIACPTLIIWGELDQSYVRTEVDFLHHHIADSVMKIIPRASHLAHLESPALFDNITNEFLHKIL